MIFLIFVSCKNEAMSASCPQQKLHSSWRFPSLFLSSLGSFTILFLQTKLGECVALWFALTPPPIKWLTEQNNPFEVFKHAARYNEFGYNKLRHCVPCFNHFVTLWLVCKYCLKSFIRRFIWSTQANPYWRFWCVEHHITWGCFSTHWNPAQHW